MKKIFILATIIGLSLLLLMVPKTYAYTITSEAKTYYNQTTSNIGMADVLDIGSTYIEYMYYDLGNNLITATDTIRIVFSDIIPTTALPLFKSTNYALFRIEISFYDITNTLTAYNDIDYYDGRSMSYFETNFRPDILNNVEYIIIKFSNITNGYDEENMHYIMQSAIIVGGNAQIINQTVSSIQYGNGWTDAMNSKVTQIWSIWGNIFDTFMSVFDIFAIQLMGDITIGHIAMVPLVLGLIGFIYALGGKRGR